MRIAIRMVNMSFMEYIITNRMYMIQIYTTEK